MVSSVLLCKDAAYENDRAFLVQVFLCLAAIILVSLLLHLPPRKAELSWEEQLKQIDFLGASLLILTVFGLLYGLDRGTNVSWRNPATLISLCATVPLLTAFLWVEARFAVAPFTPGHIIFDRTLVSCYAQNFFGYAGFTALIFYLPMFFQVVMEMTPAKAGAGLIPAAISAVVGTLLGGIILKRTGKFYWLALVASTVGALAAVPIAVAPSLKQGSLLTIYIASVASFVPQGMTVTASLIAISEFCRPVIFSVLIACSLERFCRRPGSCDCMLISLPLTWFSCQRFFGRVGDSTGTCYTASRSAGSPRSREDNCPGFKESGSCQTASP